MRRHRRRPRFPLPAGSAMEVMAVTASASRFSCLMRRATGVMYRTLSSFPNSCVEILKTGTMDGRWSQKIGNRQSEAQSVLSPRAETRQYEFAAFLGGAIHRDESAKFVVVGGGGGERQKKIIDVRCSRVAR